MNCLNIMTEIMRGCHDHVRNNVKVEGVGNMVLVIFFNKTAIAFSMKDGVVAATLPDSLASHFDKKEIHFNLYMPESICGIQRLIEDVLIVATKLSDHTGNFLYGPLSDEDQKVIVDLFLERLPMVWQDAVAELNKGVSMARVISEIKDGHIIRILKKMGYDTESWIKEFEEFHA